MKTWHKEGTKNNGKFIGSQTQEMVREEMEEVRRKKQRGRCVWNYESRQEYEMRPPGKEEDEEKE